MSYETRQEQAKRDAEYALLERRSAQLVDEVTQLMERATALHNASPTQEEKDDVVAWRDQLVADMRIPLGV